VFSNTNVFLLGETPQSSSHHLTTSSKTVGSAAVQLLTATADGNENYVSNAARQTANALKGFSNAARGVAATSSNPKLQNTIIDCAQLVMTMSSKLIIEVQKTISSPTNSLQRVMFLHSL